MRRSREWGLCPSPTGHDTGSEKNDVRSPGLHRPLALDVWIAREQQDVVLPLMIALSMVMLDVFAQCAPQGALAEEDHLGQALFLHRPDPALRTGIQVRAARRQRERFNPT